MKRLFRFSGCFSCGPRVFQVEDAPWLLQPPATLEPPWHSSGSEKCRRIAQHVNFVLFVDMYRLCLDLRILRLCLDFSPPLGLMYDMFCFQTAIRCGVSHVSIGFGF